MYRSWTIIPWSILGAQAPDGDPEPPAVASRGQAAVHLQPIAAQISVAGTQSVQRFAAIDTQSSDTTDKNIYVPSSVNFLGVSKLRSAGPMTFNGISYPYTHGRPYYARFPDAPFEPQGRGETTWHDISGRMRRRYVYSDHRAVSAHSRRPTTFRRTLSRREAAWDDTWLTRRSETVSYASSNPRSKVLKRTIGKLNLFEQDYRVYRRLRSTKPCADGERLSWANPFLSFLSPSVRRRHFVHTEEVHHTHSQSRTALVEWEEIKRFPLMESRRVAWARRISIP